MSRTRSVRLRVVSNNVFLSGMQHPVSRGEYDGHIDWAGPENEPHMASVQLMLDGVPSMQCEVLRYLKSGDIRVAD